MPTTLKDEAAIVGIGQTEYSKNSGCSEVQIACEATRNAILDAGLAPSDIDGLLRVVPLPLYGRGSRQPQ